MFKIVCISTGTEYGRELKSEKKEIGQYPDRAGAEEAMKRRYTFAARSAKSGEYQPNEMRLTGHQLDYSIAWCIGSDRFLVDCTEHYYIEEGE